jgi:hypothetical protein
VEAFLPFTLHSKAQLGVTEEFVIWVCTMVQSYHQIQGCGQTVPSSPENSGSRLNGPLQSFMALQL